MEEEQAEPQMGALQQLNAIRAKDKPTARKLMYVVSMANNRRDVVALVDTRATHNFVAERMVKRLGLKLGTARFRPEAKPIAGIAKAASVKLVREDSIVVSDWILVLPFKSE
ncbi:hypothetical protein AMTR_s00130p00118740 [Amborella trichopoda]|uniref:Aspartic peptidase DDI1-type domain-containing protein n=1 Tax=Amborella trichopoda TaxID=13333 RepID=W1NPH0_AMBTC|nr:hypothetical protein AMTR_s00130p00118740 [Amborella trichopoda]